MDAIAQANIQAPMESHIEPRVLGRIPYRKTVGASFMVKHEAMRLDFAFGVSFGNGTS